MNSASRKYHLMVRGKPGLLWLLRCGMERIQFSCYHGETEPLTTTQRVPFSVGAQECLRRIVFERSAELSSAQSLEHLSSLC
jgi:hypothetical protein